MDTIGVSGREPVCIPSVEEVAEFRRVVNTVIGKWKIDILFVLLAGPRRFGELRRLLPGITQTMLTSQLRALEADGLVGRTAFATIPPRVDYELTGAAYALKPIFADLVGWSRNRKGLAPSVQGVCATAEEGSEAQDT
ncbi:winged helix-turn-helix transcriptional regulator [Aureimonas sp. AU40]|uniref:winged helix-turn-helix transcriptional regulator n=1 Tax=Aureimonas sp. AU40 TaxID=1637747 RepID=UPI0009EA642F|nr:helix-turn-helix domain-containing protein [Aureimonas sp. AU40]